MKRFGVMAAIVAACLVLASPASAQPASDTWQVTVEPYLMGAAMSGTSGVKGLEAEVDMSASDIFSNLEFGAMGIVAARKGNWGVGTDLIWMNLGATADRPGC